MPSYSQILGAATHMVVLGGLEENPEQPVGPRAGAGGQHCLIQVLLGLHGQHQLKQGNRIYQKMITSYHKPCSPSKVSKTLVIKKAALFNL